MVNWSGPTASAHGAPRSGRAPTAVDGARVLSVRNGRWLQLRQLPLPQAPSSTRTTFTGTRSGVRCLETVAAAVGAARVVALRLRRHGLHTCHRRDLPARMVSGSSLEAPAPSHPGSCNGLASDLSGKGQARSRAQLAGEIFGLLNRADRAWLCLGVVGLVASTTAQLLAPPLVAGRGSAKESADPPRLCSNWPGFALWGLLWRSFLCLPRRPEPSSPKTSTASFRSSHEAGFEFL